MLVGTTNLFSSKKYRVFNCFDIDLQIHRQNMVANNSNYESIGYT